MTKQFSSGGLVRISGRKRYRYGRVIVEDAGGIVIVEAYDDEVPGETARISCTEDDLELVPPDHVSEEDLGKIARYELTFRKAAPGAGPADENVIYGGSHDMTPEDLRTALINIRDGGDFFGVVKSDWFSHICRAGELAARLGVMMTDEERRGEFEHLLPVNDRDVIILTLYELGRLLSDPRESAIKPRDSEALKALIDRLDLYIEEREKPLAERRFSEEDEERFIRSCAEDQDSLDEEERVLFRRICDRMCEEGSADALRIKGSACYGGSAAYPCDWEASCSCLRKYFELTADPAAANSLGYIFFYGRCTDGPDYEKAYRYFSFGALNGIHQSLYKLGDMFMEGLGVIKSPETALRLYSKVYEETLVMFEDGDMESSFADAALRMARASEKGVIPMMDGNMAYHYCLQADLAIKKRRKYGYYGDDVVEAKMEDLLEKSRPGRFFRTGPTDTVEYGDLSWLLVMTEWNARSVRAYIADQSGPADNRYVKLVLEVIDRPDDRGEHRTLLTVDEADYCDLVRATEVELGGVSLLEIDVCESGGSAADGSRASFVYDDVDIDFENNLYIFRHDDIETARIAADSMTWRVPKKSVE